MASRIGSVFTSTIGGLFTNNSSSSSSSSGNATTANPVGTNFGSNSPVKWMKSVLGKLNYSQSGPRDPEKGSADCSSTVKWAIKKAGGPDIGSNTLDQMNNTTNLSTVWENNGNYADSSVLNSMKPNDLIFFSRPTSSFTQGRKYRVGHVGLYEGDGMYIDHGSNGGTREKTLKFGNNGKIVKVSRLTGAGSGLYSYNDLALAAGGSSGLLLASRAGAANGGITMMRESGGRLIPLSGGASAVKNTMSSIQKSVEASRADGVSADLVNQLIASITKILNSINNNTAPIEKIYNALNDYIKSKSSGGASGIENNTSTGTTNINNINVSGSSNEIDSNLAGLVGVLAELAKG
jgi:cell wall-associated NlpC family hydrolase